MKIPLDKWHREHGDIVEFAGFDMPIMYGSIKKEHMAVRDEVGIFDVSHMGRMNITGSDAEKFLNILVPRDLSKTPVGRASYTFMLNEQSGFRDDVVFLRLAEDRFLLVWNAGNFFKIPAWMAAIKNSINHFKTIDVSFDNISANSAMFALQGPKARKVLEQLVKDELPSSWRIVQTEIAGVKVLISGTGYTGETGFEIIVFDTSFNNPNNAQTVWEAILSVEEPKVTPCGLGARDSLRLEAGYPLYGNDIEENINPIEADLFFPPFVHMDKEFFIGKNKLEELKQADLPTKRIGFVALKKGPSPRRGMPLLYNDQEVGQVVSGGFSPLLNIGIGMGYIKKEYTKPGTVIQFKVKNKLFDAEIRTFPLFDPEKYGGKRKTA